MPSAFSARRARRSSRARSVREVQEVPQKTRVALWAAAMGAKDLSKTEMGDVLSLVHGEEEVGGLTDDMGGADVRTGKPPGRNQGSIYAPASVSRGRG